MLEMLQSEGGLDAIVETGGVCRLGYYGALQKQILRDLGYGPGGNGQTQTARLLRRRKTDQSRPSRSPKRHGTLPDALKAVRYIDEMEGRVRLDRGFERQRGSMKAVFDTFLQEISSAKNRKSLDAAYQKASAALSAVALDKPENPLRVGIVGEYYTVMDDFGNHNVEQILGYMGRGVEIHRWMTFTHRNLEYDEQADLQTLAPYVRYSMGPTTSATLAGAIRLRRCRLRRHCACQILRLYAGGGCYGGAAEHQR